MERWVIEDDLLKDSREMLAYLNEYSWSKTYRNCCGFVRERLCQDYPESENAIFIHAIANKEDPEPF